MRAALVGDPHDERLLATTPTPTSVLAPPTAWAAVRSWDLHDIEVRRPTLEDIYLALTATDDAGDDA